MSVQNLIIKRVLKLIKRWWERRQAWKSVKDAPPVIPPKKVETVSELLAKRRPAYHNRSVHSQQMKEEHDSRNSGK